MTRKKKPTTSLVRSSAAEYLTFVAASGTGGVEAVYADENVWLSQKMMAQLYDVEVPTINYHLKKVFEDSELEEDSVIRNFRITAADGKTYDTKHYNLSAIIAVGYKVNSERAVQFRKWATRVVEEFTIKGFAMDDERLKRGGSVLSDRYFEEQLQRVREIRLSERKFYQKITDIYATSVDYDVTAQATKRFFAMVQNKLHWAIHGQTAAEVIVERADATKEHMGLHSWADAPLGKLQNFAAVTLVVEMFADRVPAPPGQGADELGAEAALHRAGREGAILPGAHHRLARVHGAAVEGQVVGLGVQVREDIADGRERNEWLGIAPGKRGMRDRSGTGEPSALRLRDPFQLSRDGWLVDTALRHTHRQLV